MDNLSIIKTVTIEVNFTAEQWGVKGVDYGISRRLNVALRRCINLYRYPKQETLLFMTRFMRVYGIVENTAIDFLKEAIDEIYNEM